MISRRSGCKLCVKAVWTVWKVFPRTAADYKALCEQETAEQLGKLCEFADFGAKNRIAGLFLDSGASNEQLAELHKRLLRFPPAWFQQGQETTADCVLRDLEAARNEAGRWAHNSKEGTEIVLKRRPCGHSDSQCR